MGNEEALNGESDVEKPRNVIKHKNYLYLAMGNELPIGTIKAQANDPNERVGCLCLFKYNKGRNGLAYFALDFASVG